MVDIVSRKLNEQITWWAVAPDGYGGDLCASPIVIAGRWEDRQESYVGQIDRRELISKAIVYCDRAISVGDYLARGDASSNLDPTVIVGPEKVQRYEKFPDLRSLEAMHKAVL